MEGLRVSDGALNLSGALRHDEVASLLPVALAAVSQVERVDVSGIGQVDSSVLALLLALKREALRLNRTLPIEQIPPNLADLARLYGIAELI